MTGSFHISLFEGTLHVDKIHVWFKIANITHVLPVPVYRQTDFTTKRGVVSLLHDTVVRFVPEWNSHPGTRTGMNSRRGVSHRHDILWWYHVNKYRATRGNRSELALGQKSPPCHVNSPLVGTPMVYQFLLLCVNPHQQKLISQWPSTKFIHLEDV